MTVCLSVCLSVSLSPTSTFKFHSAEGTTVSDDAAVSLY